MSQPNTFVKYLTPLLLAMALAACGGGTSSFGGKSDGGGSGGDDGGDDTGSGTEDKVSVAASKIVLSTNTYTLATGTGKGTDAVAPVVVTAVAKDENNVVIEGANIEISVNDSDATLSTKKLTGAVTTTNLTTDNKKNRLVTITATSGGQSRTTLVDISGTTLETKGPDAITLNTPVAYIIKLEDSEDKAIANEEVTITTSANLTENYASATSSAAGEVAFTLTGNTAGDGTVTASALGTSFTKDVKVSNDVFSLSTVNVSEEINIGVNETINFTWTEGGVPKNNEVITLSATRGTITPNNPATITTNVNGAETFTISSTTAGQTVITATSSTGLSTSLTREFIAFVPAYLNTQAEPTLLHTNGSSTITTRVLDATHNPVKNQTIDFRLTDAINGTLSSATAKTDSSGRASVTYTAGDSSSAKDGVVIDTFIQGTNPLITDTINLTVGGNAVRLVLGFDHLIVAKDAFYEKQFVVIVTDSNGRPIENKNVNFSINPVRYWKGQLVFDVANTRWITGYTTPNGCPNEDFNKNGNLDIGEDLNANGILDAGEDTNNNGVLDPDEDVNNNGTLEPSHDATVVGTGTTDAAGQVIVIVKYPKNTAWWSEQKIEATLDVNGTEFKESTTFPLPVLNDDVAQEGEPPNYRSPYGTTGVVCSDPN